MYHSFFVWKRVFAMKYTSNAQQSTVRHIASFLGSGSLILLAPSLYGMYFIAYGGDSMIIIITTIVFSVGCLLCAGYIQIARNKTYWLQPRQVWIATIVFNIFLLMFTSVFFLSGMWCFSIWQASAVILAIVALYKQDTELDKQ